MASLRLVCFPYAGGGASAYRLWPSLLPRQVEVLAAQLPGREDRLREEPIRAWDALVDAAVTGLLPHLSVPYALFGHSMGAALACDVAGALQRSAARRPAHLFVSGRPGPGEDPWQGPMLASLEEDGAFLEALKLRYGSIDDAALDDPEIREVVLPGLRADVAALESRPEAQEALDCPITAYGGASDPSTSAEGLDAWSKATRAAFRARTLPGGHFFLHESRRELLADVGAVLAAPGHGGARRDAGR